VAHAPQNDSTLPGFSGRSLALNEFSTAIKQGTSAATCAAVLLHARSLN
jgi:hypothetical protein